MVNILAVLQIAVCAFLILLIMIQDPKGGGSGLFSGNSNSIMGSGGGADFLTKLTRYVAIVFGALCIALTIVTKPAKTGVFSKPGATSGLEQPATTIPTPAPGADTTPFDAKATAPAAPAPAQPGAQPANQK